ncbi:hypothetical protein DM02DRAFT_616813 [Periconia macrospinosa]|uniref:F-box domain-containing protein n=1 Tax=Periconia macrospinosa TaxID=97972 RepID=A0A2V1DG29_9PLEO|nr:hypothetical protein DM02DRAFT_616813 [Periconia macrospinosa]
MSRVCDTPQRSTSKLLALVDELLLAVIDQIDFHSTLCNLAATSSRFQGLAEPYVWRTLLVTSGAHARNIAYALDSREERSSYVQELSIQYPDDRRDGIEELNHFIGLMSRLRHLTIESPCPNNSEWLGPAIYFDGSTRIDYPTLLEASVFPRPGLPSVLPMLQRLTLHGHGTDDKKFVLGRSAVMFLHPTLRHIEISCTNFDAGTTHASIPLEKKKSTPLQSLTLIECNVNVKFLDVVLSLPKALKELRIGERQYVFEGCHPSYDPETRTSHPLFLDALARQADSLERLAHNSGRLNFIVKPKTHKPTGNAKLRNLIKLEFLELGLESTLVSHLEANDCPPSLQTLKITDTAWWNQIRSPESRHPGAVLGHCSKIIQNISNTINLDIRFDDHNCEDILGVPRTSPALESIVGGPIREPLYKLASALTSRNARLRLYAFHFVDGKRFIPPYMYGEEAPYERQFYDSDDFWRVSGTNYRILDDEEYYEKVCKKDDRVFCAPCEGAGVQCKNSGDGTPCFRCEVTRIECVYVGPPEVME